MLNNPNNDFNRLPSNQFEQVQQQNVQSGDQIFPNAQQPPLLPYGGGQLPQLVNPQNLLAQSYAGAAYAPGISDNQVDLRGYQQQLIPTPSMENVAQSSVAFQHDLLSAQMARTSNVCRFYMSSPNLQDQRQLYSTQAQNFQGYPSIHPSYLNQQPNHNLYIQQQQDLYRQQQQQQQYLQAQGFQPPGFSPLVSQRFQQNIHPTNQPQLHIAQGQPSQLPNQVQGSTYHDPSLVPHSSSQLPLQSIVRESPKSAAERAAKTAEENVRRIKQMDEQAHQKREEQAKSHQVEIETELKRSRAMATEFSAAMRSRLEAVPETIHLGCCHTLTKVGDLLPLPSECSNVSHGLAISEDSPTIAPANEMAEYLVQLLNSSMSLLNDVELRHDEEERNDLSLDEMNQICLGIHRIDQNALNVEKGFTSDGIMSFDQDIQRVVDEVTSSGFHPTAVQPMKYESEAHSSTSLQEGTADDTTALEKKNCNKEPAAVANRRKRDMVEDLYDSLTDYFDPSTSGRRRNRESDDENDKTDREVGRFFNLAPKQPKKSKLTLPDRPSTPEEVIHQRDREWKERIRLREEKQRRQEHQDDRDVWSNEIMAQNECLSRFVALNEHVLEQFSEIGADDDLIIELNILEELRVEVQKLKAFRKVNKVPSDRLSKLISVLEKTMRDVLNDDGALQDEGADTLARDILDERICRAAEASCISMCIMTSPKIPKQILSEDSIERCVQICQQYCQQLLFPVFDNSLGASDSGTSSKAKKAVPASKKRKSFEKANPFVMSLYRRMCELIGCFAELCRFETLSETTLSRLCTLGTPVFFIDGVNEMQVECIRLLTTIFSLAPTLRRMILQDLLESLHRLPSTKNQRNSCRLTENVWISNFAVLVLQLIQSVVKVPSKRKNEAMDELDDVQQNDIVVENSAVIESYQETQSLAAVFFSGFLSKCTAKSEDDYRHLFEVFLQDVLSALYHPTYPVAELLLTVLGNLLIKRFRSKAEMTMRIACLDYLGTITARLRKDRVHNRSDDKNRLDLVIRTIVAEEKDESVESVDISNMSITEKIQKLEQSLIDYVITKSSDDVSVEYTVLFYVAEWYKETVADMEAAKERHRQFIEQNPSADVKKEERKLNKILERGEQMKPAILRLVDKKYLKQRTQVISSLGNVMLDSDAHWVVKYLASKREFSQSFGYLLKQITFGVSNETAVGLRTKAMRCLTQIIEADYSVLSYGDVQAAVSGRLVDPNISVREATAELLGKYIISKPDLLDKYYPMLITRIVDTGVAVRKRIVRILRDVVEMYPESERVPEILAKIVRRVSDEEGVKKLVLESMYSLWFQPAGSRDQLDSKITVIIDTVAEMIGNSSIEYFKLLVAAIFKEYTEKGFIQEACVQIVDAMVDKVLSLDQEMANVETNEGSDISESVLEKKRIIQRRLTACLSTLSVFSSVKAELLVRHAQVFGPYLEIKPSSPTEMQVLISILQMLEKIVPLEEHPSESFLQLLDQRLDDIVQSQNNIGVISAAVACSGAIYRTFPKYRPALLQLFLKFITYLKMKQFEKITDVAKENIPMLRKVMFSVGVISRYFDIDAIAAKFEVKDVLDQGDAGGMRTVVLNLLCGFYQSESQMVRIITLKAFGQLTAECPEYLLTKSVQNVYVSALKDRRMNILKQVLSNLDLFLISAEERALKHNEQFRLNRGGGLKEMELGNSGLSSSAIQYYWNAVLHAYFNPNDDVRQEAANVIYQTQNQGLLTPGTAIPTLIAMSTDRLPSIRTRIEALVKEIDAKYSGMVSSRAIDGIRKAFKLQCIIRRDQTEIIRGTRPVDSKPTNELQIMSNDVQSMLSGLYSCLRHNRQQRRGFLTNLLKLFGDNAKEKVSLQEWIFIADNLAHFSYVNLDEPLFVIFSVNKLVSLGGQNILNAFKRQQMGGPSNEEEDELSPNVIYARMPQDKTSLYELKKDSLGCYLLLALKSYLIRMYNFKEDKIKEYSPSESAKVYEKPVIRRNIGVFSPKSILDTCKTNPASDDSIQQHIELAQHFSNFFNKLLSLDRGEDSADEEGVAEESVPADGDEAMEE